MLLQQRSSSRKGPILLGELEIHPSVLHIHPTHRCMHACMQTGLFLLVDFERLLLLLLLLVLSYLQQQQICCSVAELPMLLQLCC